MADDTPWESTKSVCYSLGSELRWDRPIAAFDLDGTLREYRGVGWSSTFAGHILDVFSESHTILILSNRKHPEEVWGFLEDSGLAAGRSLSVIISTQRDAFRKPHTGMWDFFRQMCGGGDKGPPAGSFFCGDAAGRVGDFSNTDRLFAENLSIQFYAPEYFEGDWTVISRATALGHKRGGYTQETLDLLEQDGDASPPPEGVDQFRVILMCGSPGSGKSTWANQLADTYGFVVVSRDVSKGAFERLGREALARGESILIDNTHGTVKSREVWHDAVLPEELLCLHCTTPKNMCFHLDAARAQCNPGVKRRPAVALHTYWKRLVAPTPQNFPGAVWQLPFRLRADASPEITEFRYELC